MSLSDLFHQLRERGISLRAHEGQLQISPASRLTPELWEALRQQKLVVLEYLAATAAADPEEHESQVQWLPDILRGMQALDPQQRGLTSGAILQTLRDRAGEFQELRACVQGLCQTSRNTLPSVRQLGSRLGHLKGWVWNGLRLTSRLVHRTSCWVIQEVSPPEGDPAATAVSPEGAP